VPEIPTVGLSDNVNPQIPCSGQLQPADLSPFSYCVRRLSIETNHWLTSHNW